MNHALAAVLSVTFNLLWFVAFVWCAWMMVTGLFRVRQRMRTLPGGEQLGLFWTWKVIGFAIRESPRQPDSRRLLRGWLGALGIAFGVAIAYAVLVALASR